jgi:hypothetical protein
MKDDPLNPPKGDFRTVQVRQYSAAERLTPPLGEVGRGRDPKNKPAFT